MSHTHTTTSAADQGQVAVFFPVEGRAHWLQALQEAWPDAHFVVWPEVAPHATQAVAWSPTQEFVDHHPQLQYLFNMGAGVDAILRLQLPQQLQIVRIEDGGMAAQMAEYVCHAVLRHVREFDHYASSQAKQLWQPRRAQAKADFPIGIMGLGVLGTHVAQCLRGFGFNVNGWSQSAKQIDGISSFAGQKALAEFLQRSRILVCLLPLTPATQGILNRHHLSQLQRGAYLINVARGGHLVEADLLELLEQGHMAGAMLDVTQQEPLPAEHPFWSHPCITITPHISAQTQAVQAAAQIADNVRRIAAGQTPSGLVDRGGGY
ncbi:glyoxylate/hydroxypyruvate reductase A [Lampropedia puyangensis]|uniref:Glyoxylate/hydroxypyruvate reductase A n=1 Tax=Lampropedia puyangensis TaxID=1330072 RepID=A0A4S8EUX7_9BURK|nr:glyoxylate/hydroxypyruvate reductase A [Lampropedia puyangensis]THT98689.1 glyoxylate/hydroxypyruvate reductase A [Lampropedia puyangensis]